MLSGFFGKALPQRVVRQAAADLLQKYVHYVRKPEVFRQLAPLAQRKADAVLCGMALRQHKIQFVWDYLHLPFKTEALTAAFALVRESKAHSGGKAPKISVETFRSRIAPGMNEYLDGYEAAVKRVKAITF
jgi:hypothetical protein